MNAQAKKVYGEILELLKNTETPNPDFWSDGQQIMASTDERANIIADFIDTLFSDTITVTGYYDPDEDERNGDTDRYTGWHYIDI